MRSVALIFMLGLLGGCTTSNQELVRDYHNDGLHLFKQGRYSDAEESFQAALKLQPADPGIYYNLGQTYDYLHRKQEAEKYYRECILRSPNHAGARHALTILLMNQNKQQEAVEGVEDWLKKSPIALPRMPRMVFFGSKWVICQGPRPATSRLWPWTPTTQGC